MPQPVTRDPSGHFIPRPRVCVVSYSFGKSSETWLWRQIRGLRRLRPHVVCSVRENPSTYSAEDIGIDVLPFELNDDSDPRRWLRRLHGLPAGNFFAATRSEFAVLHPLLKSLNPDVILCHFGPVGLRLLPVARALGVPIVVHFHGIDISRALGSRWYRYSLVNVLRQFARLIVVAGYQREWIHSHCKTRSAADIIPCGVPCSEFSPSRDVGVQPCRFLAVGRFVEKKAPMEVVRAFAACRAACPETEMTMIGAGPLEQETHGLAQRLGVSRAIHFLGEQPTSRVRIELQKAGAFVQHSVTSSRGDMEGWPVSIAEAAASALPVIATNHGEIPLQVQDGLSGLLVAEGDWEGMASAMIRLAKDADLRIRLGRAGRRHMAANYDMSRQIERLEDVLLGACRESPPATVD